MLDKLPVFSTVLALAGTVAYMWVERLFSFTAETFGGFLLLALALWPIELLLRKVFRKPSSASPAKNVDDEGAHT
ncbi:MAG: hypothetical protein HC861_01525 [Rhodospirillaceae bacterium]|nr:hypothetical protein [Rhodospirillaceae bacterium]